MKKTYSILSLIMILFMVGCSNNVYKTNKQAMEIMNNEEPEIIKIFKNNKEKFIEVLPNASEKDIYVNISNKIVQVVKKDTVITETKNDVIEFYFPLNINSIGACTFSVSIVYFPNKLSADEIEKMKSDYITIIDENWCVLKDIIWGT